MYQQQSGCSRKTKDRMKLHLSSKLQEQVKRVETDRSRPLIALQDFPDNSIVIWKFNKYSNFIFNSLGKKFSHLGQEHKASLVILLVDIEEPH